MTQPLIIPSLPTPLRWYGAPTDSNVSADHVLSIRAGQRTDWFIDPEGTVNVLNAPAALFKAQQPAMLKALVSSEAKAKYDAGVLTVYQNDQSWAKLCLERSPQGELLIVSVVTKGTSDDCNSLPAPADATYLRIAKLERAYAFHYSADGRVWNLIRYFTLGGSSDVEMGFLSQSPTGEGCTATFSQIAYQPGKLADVRSGE